ncbi:hypothetical protein [Streptomyces sp. KR80]|uniref:hypothetical protein n=1 Tax=Streptomyces sp. KR80 TaxID=3457426 RepID=UPI003FD2E5C2
MRRIATAVLGAVALIGVLAAPAAAVPPLPVPAGAEPLVTEGVTVEGPVINNLTLPGAK